MQPGKLDLSKVRHPRERLVLWLSVVANAAVAATAVAVVYLAPEWAAQRAHVSALVDRIRLTAVAAILILPVLALVRRARSAVFCENSVRLGRDQVPEIYSILERHCRTLDVEPPELYVSTVQRVGISISIALLGGRRIVVLGPQLFAGLARIRDRADVLEFVLASELGRLALGHASWWGAVLLEYLKRVPVLREPLLTVQTASRDRFAATLSPRATLRGLAFVAVGGDLIDHVDTAAFVRQVMNDATPGWAAKMGQVGRDDSHLAQRVRDLYRSGFLDLERDLASGARALAAEHAATETAIGEDRHPPLHP